MPVQLRTLADQSVAAHRQGASSGHHCDGVAVLVASVLDGEGVGGGGGWPNGTSPGLQWLARRDLK